MFKVALVLAIAGAAGLLVVRQDLQGDSPLALSVFIDDPSVVVVKDTGGVDLLVRIRNVSKVDQVVPLASLWTGRLSLVQCAGTQAQGAGGYCQAGRDPNVGWTIKPGECIDYFRTFAVGELIKDKDSIGVRVRYNSVAAKIHILTAKIGGQDFPEAAQSVAVVEVPSIELVSECITIHRAVVDNAIVQSALQQSARQVSTDVWSRYAKAKLHPPGTGDDARADSGKAREQTYDMKEAFENLYAGGGSQWSDDALMDMMVAAHANGDTEAEAQIKSELCTRFPHSTGCAEATAFADQGTGYLRRSERW